MDRFGKLNPYVSFLFFIFEIVLTLLLFNPVFIAVSLVSSLLYSIRLQGKRAVRVFFTFLLPFIVLTAVFNMLFVSYGETVLFTLFSKSFTLETMLYGLCQGMMCSGVIMWISCYSIVLSADKFIFLFSRFAPNLTLIFSMVLSFLPRLRKNASEISDARKNISSKSKLLHSIENFSALITITLEDSIQTADSMKARGFNKNRTPYSRYPFSFADGVMLCVSALLFSFIMIYKASGRLYFTFEPKIEYARTGAIPIVLYCLFSLIPVIIDLTEDIRWFYLKRRA